MASPRALRHAPWSSSKVQMALRCPREFHYRYVDKVREPETMPEMFLGKVVHEVLERVLRGESPDVVLADERAKVTTDLHQRFDAMVRGVPQFLRRIREFKTRRRVQRSMYEFTLAVREDFTSTAFYSGDALFRGVFDAGFVYDRDHIAIIDHKTGFRAHTVQITEQLQAYAALAAAQFPQARRFYLGVHWVGDGDIVWQRPVEHAEINSTFLPAVLDNIEAAALAVDDGPRPDAGLWCSRCSYRSICPAAEAVLSEPADDDYFDPYD